MTGAFKFLPLFESRRCNCSFCDRLSGSSNFRRFFRVPIGGHADAGKPSGNRTSNVVEVEVVLKNVIFVNKQQK